MPLVAEGADFTDFVCLSLCLSVRRKTKKFLLDYFYGSWGVASLWIREENGLNLGRLGLGLVVRVRNNVCSSPLVD